MSIPIRDEMHRREYIIISLATEMIYAIGQILSGGKCVVWVAGKMIKLQIGKTKTE